MGREPAIGDQVAILGQQAVQLGDQAAHMHRRLVAQPLFHVSSRQAAIRLGISAR
jgi:hypothetical protein